MEAPRLGAHVVLNGLVARADLNGVSGDVIGPLNDSGRVPVRVRDNGELRMIGIRPVNMRLVADLHALPLDLLLAVSQDLCTLLPLMCVSHYFKQIVRPWLRAQPILEVDTRALATRMCAAFLASSSLPKLERLTLRDGPRKFEVNLKALLGGFVVDHFDAIDLRALRTHVDKFRASLPGMVVSRPGARRECQEAKKASVSFALCLLVATHVAHAQHAHYRLKAGLVHHLPCGGESELSTLPACQQPHTHEYQDLCMLFRAACLVVHSRPPPNVICMDCQMAKGMIRALESEGKTLAEYNQNLSGSPIHRPLQLTSGWHTSITKVKCHNSWSTSDVTAVVFAEKLFPLMPHLEAFAVGTQLTTDATLEAIAGALRSHNMACLTRLDVQGGYHTDVGAVALATTLGKGICPSLKSLGLGSPHVTDEGVAAVATSLSALAALEELSLGCNMLEKGRATDAGYQMLAEALGKEVPRLCALRLDHAFDAASPGIRAIQAARPGGKVRKYELFYLEMNWTPWWSDD